MTGVCRRGVTGIGQTAAVDLRTWILDDHTAVAERFDTAVAAHVPVDRWTERPGGEGACLAWLLFHLTVHEDLAVQAVLCGGRPLLDAHRDALGLAGVGPAVGLGEADLRDVSDGLDPGALVDYHRAVTGATRAWLGSVDLAVLDTVPDSGAALERCGIGADEVPWLHRMWAGRPGAWFVRWEAIGHPQNHLGEMVALRGRLGCSPF